MNCTFFNISAATIVSKWRGDSEKIIKVLFDMARYYQPSTIFLDEIDSIMNKRSSTDEHEGSRRMKTELLIQLDGLSKRENERVFLLAASNMPWDLDHALLRRLEKRVIISLPDELSRKTMIEKFIPLEKQSNLNYELFAKRLEGYSGSDIKLVCKECLMRAVRRAISRL
jgi:katanin p60 ATPase-containing subunit A1